MELNFTVTNQKIKYVSNLYIVEKSRNYLTAKFSFSGNEWKNVVKTAIFKKDDTVVNVLLDESGRCNVPWEVITKGTLKVSVFGGDLVTVDTADVKILKSGYEEGNAPSEPTPDVYAQILTELQDIRSEYVTEEMLGQAVEDWLAENVVEALSPEDVQKIVYGWLEGHKTELKGEKGDAGKDGIDGATFTPKIVDGVLSWENNSNLNNPTSFDFNEELGINTIKSDVETLKDKKDITSTTSTTQPNSYAGREMVLEIGGVTEQDSTTGNQLCESVTIGPETNIYNSALIIKADFKPNTQYTFSFKGAVGNRYYINENAFVDDLTVTVVDGVNTFTATTKNDFSGQVSSDGCLVLKNHKNQSNQNKFEEVMVNLGNTALPYEPYTGGIPAPNPSYPMEIKKSVVSGVKTHRKNFVEPSTTSITDMTYSGGIYTSIPKGTWGTTFIRLEKSTTFKKGTAVYASFKARRKSGAGNINYFFVKNEKNNLSPVISDRVNYTLGSDFILASCKMTFEEDIECDTILIQVDNKAVDMVFEVKDIMVSLDTDFENYEPFQGTEITLSQPIELYGIGDVQDVIKDGKIKRRFTKAVFDGTEGWVQQATRQFYLPLDTLVKKGLSDYYNSILCDRYKVIPSHAQTLIEGICGYYDSSNNYPNSNWLYIIKPNIDTREDFIASLQANPITVVYELATPTTEALPIADQIGLNSLATYDGITYVEFDSEIQPTFKAEYGTSKVGGYTLESLLTARNNELKQNMVNERLSALEASVVNNI